MAAKLKQTVGMASGLAQILVHQLTCWMVAASLMYVPGFGTQTLAHFMNKVCYDCEYYYYVECWLLMLLQYGWPRSVDMSPKEPWHVQIRLSNGSNMQSVTVSMGSQSFRRLSRL